jgi:hypothetical protein
MWFVRWNQSRLSHRQSDVGRPAGTGGQHCLYADRGHDGSDELRTIANGSYSIAAGDRGPVVGKHKVGIEAYRDAGTVDDGGAPLKDQIVPAKYNKETTLVVEVTKGSNTHDFDLVSE